MKKLREMFPLDDRTKLTVSISAVGLVLVAALLVPLGFRTEKEAAPAVSDNTREAKTALFAAYWNGDPADADIFVEKPEQVAEERKQACETVMRELTDRCINDRALEQPTPTGWEYTVLHSGGTEVQLCRTWMETKGDWQNWLDVCFDSETGELYYLYLSRECLSNLLLYQGENTGITGAEDIARLMAEKYGWTLRYVGNGEGDAAAALFSSDGGTLCYEIGCKFYDSLVDVKICCR